MSTDFQIIPKSISESIVDTFKTMAQENAEIVSVVAESPKLESELGIIAVIGIKSSSFTGSIAIHFPSSTFIPLMNKMLGENHTSIGPGNADGASEFLNIIYSSARVKINEAGFDFNPAIPATIKGKDLELPSTQSAKVLKLNCKCTFGAFTVVVALMKK